MHVCTDPFWVPKEGNSDAEYEDAFWPLEPTEQAGHCLRFAVADGATEASFSKLWAGLLVEAFCRGELSGGRYRENLLSLQAQWQAEVTARPLSWFAEEKMRSGAFSSILGLVLDDSPAKRGRRRWGGYAMGDSCIVQMRGDAILASFPLDTSAAFNNRPLLLSSNPARNGEVAWMKRGGAWESDDLFFLMTDALACWFMSEAEEGGKPWNLLRDLQPGDDAFSEFVADLRHKRAIRNDDVTLLRVTVN